MDNQNQYLMGFNTRNISTSNRTSVAVSLGSLYGSKGSISRIYNWCSRRCSEPLNCVFQKVIQNNISPNPSPSPSPTPISYWYNINVSNLNLGQIYGNIGENGQIIIGGTNGKQLMFSNDLGNTWSPYQNSPTLPFLTIGWISLVMSDDTNSVIALPYVPTNVSQSLFTTYNGINYTTNGGNTWSLLQSCPLNGGGTLNFNDTNNTNNSLLFIDAGISQDGQYMAALTTPRNNSGTSVYLIVSNNAGANWIAYQLSPYTIPYTVTSFATSISITNVQGANDIFLITSNLVFNPISSTYQDGTVCLSTNGGTSFTVPNGVDGNDFIYSSISDSGQYQVFVTATNTNSSTPIPSRLYLSTDSGTSFNKVLELTYTDSQNYLVFGGVSMSADGKIITASVSDITKINVYLYVSSDYGNTWKQINTDSNNSPFNTTNSYIGLGFLNTNKSGKYQMLSGTDTLFINNNYGN